MKSRAPRNWCAALFMVRLAAWGGLLNLRIRWDLNFGRIYMTIFRGESDMKSDFEEYI